MTNPFKRFFGGITIGIFLSVLLIYTQDESVGSQFLATIRAMPLLSSHAFLESCVAFLGLACACVGAMATQKARLSFPSRSTVETFRRRRQTHRNHHVL